MTIVGWHPARRVRAGEGAGTVGWFLRWFPAGVSVRADVEEGAQPLVWETLLSRGKLLVVLGRSGSLRSEVIIVVSQFCVLANTTLVVGLKANRSVNSALLISNYVQRMLKTICCTCT